MAQRAQSAPMIRNVGANIRYISRGKGKTIEQMAAVICRDRRTWCNRMKDPGSFTLLELSAVCKFLNTTMERLLQTPE